MSTNAVIVGNVTHGARSKRRVRGVAGLQKRRLLRQIGMRQSQMDGIGQAYLDSWSRAQAKVELMDAWANEHGWLTPDGAPPPFTLVYVSMLNTARLAIDRLSDHLRHQKPPIIVDLRAYRPAREGEP